MNIKTRASLFFSDHKHVLSPQALGHSADGSDESDKGGVQPRPRLLGWGLLCSVRGSISSCLRGKTHHFSPCFISATYEVEILKHPHHTGIFLLMWVFALSAREFTKAGCSRAAK